MPAFPQMQLIKRHKAWPVQHALVDAHIHWGCVNPTWCRWLGRGICLLLPFCQTLLEVSPDILTALCLRNPPQRGLSTLTPAHHVSSCPMLLFAQFSYTYMGMDYSTMLG